jgi:predicted metal-dependent phosphotriesterase family hydrolase
MNPAALRASAVGEGVVETVRGPLETRNLGTTLVHEHVLVDFGGAATASRSRYDAEAVYRTVLPQLEELARRGCRTLFECTPAYLGRDPQLLRRLADASGLQIVTNTGYYGAAKDIAVPKHAYAESAAELAARFVAEFRNGIEGTGIRPGFVKVGVDAGPLSAIDRKLVEAGALAHRDTGLTLAIHTGDGRAAIEIVRVLAERGVAPSAYVWVHAQNEPDRATRGWAAQQGVFVELDGVSPGASMRTSTRSSTSSAATASTASWCRRTPAGTTSASQAAAATGRTRSSSTASCLRCGPQASARTTSRRCSSATRRRHSPSAAACCGRSPRGESRAQLGGRPTTIRPTSSGSER